MKIGKMFLSFDSFGEKFEMNIDSGGAKKVPTISGAIVSLPVLLLLLVYSVYKT